MEEPCLRPGQEEALVPSLSICLIQQTGSERKGVCTPWQLTKGPDQKQLISNPPPTPNQHSFSI